MHVTFVVTISSGEKDCVGRKEGSRRVGLSVFFRQTAFALVVSAAFASAQVLQVKNWICYLSKGGPELSGRLSSPEREGGRETDTECEPQDSNARCLQNHG